MAEMKQAAREKIRAYIREQREMGRRMNYEILAGRCKNTSPSTFGGWMAGYYPPLRVQIKPIMKEVGLTFADIYGVDE